MENEKDKYIEAMLAEDPDELYQIFKEILLQFNSAREKSPFAR